MTRSVTEQSWVSYTIVSISRQATSQVRAPSFISTAVGILKAVHNWHSLSKDIKLDSQTTMKKLILFLFLVAQSLAVPLPQGNFFSAEIWQQIKSCDVWRIFCCHHLDIWFEGIVIISSICYHRVWRMELSLQSNLLDTTIYQTKYRSLWLAISDQNTYHTFTSEELLSHWLLKSQFEQKM